VLHLESAAAVTLQQAVRNRPSLHAKEQSNHAGDLGIMKRSGRPEKKTVVEDCFKMSS